MSNGLQLSSRAVAAILARIFGPAIYDAPPFDGGPPYRNALIDLVRGPVTDPLSWVALNPQPLPPRERYAIAIADAHIQELVVYDRLAVLFGSDMMERTQDRALRYVAELDEVCPRWPRWPKRWPPPPPPPWGEDVMDPAVLFLYGSRFLGAAQMMEPGALQDAVANLGERAMALSMESLRVDTESAS